MKIRKNQIRDKCQSDKYYASIKYMAHSLRGKDRENFIITVCDLNIYLGCICALTCEKNATVAEHARGEEVAIKILREESGNGKKAVKRNRKKRIRFKIETEMVVGIQDEIKGVIPIFSYGLPDEKTKKYWYAMPIAIPLEDKLKEVKSLEDKVNCVLELARTLEALHKKDIVHRDIKPKNIYF